MNKEIKTFEELEQGITELGIQVTKSIFEIHFSIGEVKYSIEKVFDDKGVLFWEVEEGWYMQNKHGIRRRVNCISVHPYSLKCVDIYNFIKSIKEAENERV